VCEQQHELVSRKKIKNIYSKNIPSMSDEIFLDKILITHQNMYLEKKKFSMLTQIDMSSLPHGSTTWTLDNNVYVQTNVNTKFHPILCPMC
jgi:hypothetical protein